MTDISFPPTKKNDPSSLVRKLSIGKIVVLAYSNCNLKVSVEPFSAKQKVLFFQKEYRVLHVKDLCLFYHITKKMRFNF